MTAPWYAHCREPLMTHTDPHIVLIGDSIFDNAAYTGGAPDVVTHLRGLLPPTWKATLCAVDGATTAALTSQLGGIPTDASHVIVSSGGNDALQNIDLLSMPVGSIAEALSMFAARLEIFEYQYRQAITNVTALGRYTAICTVYNGALDKTVAPAARMGLTLFNDVILRTAVDLGLDAIELRSICVDAADYVNAIEPSAAGGLKIARALAHALGASPASMRASRVWGRGGPSRT
jgi:hypothetical protein